MKKRQPAQPVHPAAAAANRGSRAKTAGNPAKTAPAGTDQGRSGGRHKSRPGKLRRRMPAKKKAVIIACSALGVVALLIVSAYLYAMGLLGNVNTVNPGDATIPDQYNPPTESLQYPVPDIDGIENILLLGVDNRETDKINERSDSMMILTIDSIHGKLKLTSLQRDMLAYIPGVDEPQKINAANALGGPALAMRTVNETFRLNISKYMVINLWGLEQVVDVAGGVELDVAADTIYEINLVIDGENWTFPNTPQASHITEAGPQLLNGRQAVAYARMRHADSDYKRMERQRNLLQALFNSFLSAGLSTKQGMVTEGLGLITTNLTRDEILGIGLSVIPKMNKTIEQLQIPIAGYFTEYSGSTWCNLCDYNGMIPLLQDFMFEERFEFDKVKVIPGAPNSGTKPTTVRPSTAPTTITTSTTLTATTATALLTEPTVLTTETAAPPTETTALPSTAASTTVPAEPTTETAAPPTETTTAAASDTTTTAA